MIAFIFAGISHNMNYRVRFATIVCVAFTFACLSHNTIGRASEHFSFQEGSWTIVIICACLSHNATGCVLEQFFVKKIHGPLPSMLLACHTALPATLWINFFSIRFSMIALICACPSHNITGYALQQVMLCCVVLCFLVVIFFVFCNAPIFALAKPTKTATKTTNVRQAGGGGFRGG